MDNNQTVVLVSTSQGERGQWGYQKKYIIKVEGRKVVVSWGRAEFGAVGYQEKTRYFANEIEATRFATETMYKKLDKGYEELVRHAN
jgi:predicted DNA-binding WGR domain protein